MENISQGKESGGKSVSLSPLLMGLCTLPHGKMVLRMAERWKLGGNRGIEVFSIVQALCRVPILELGWNYPHLSSQTARVFSWLL